MYDAKKKQKNIERAKAAKEMEITLDVEDKVIKAVQDYYDKVAGSTPEIGVYTEEPDVIVLELRPPKPATDIPKIRGSAQSDETKKLRKRTLRILTDEKAVDAINAFVNSKFESDVIGIWLTITRDMELRIRVKALMAGVAELGELATRTDPADHAHGNGALRK
ncbi:MAG: hypothetical protein LVQ97_03670 [Candidatus Micrarchaeales archaeon]|jgi:hypothetical protein|nr:hypothetical protein [Candidatus Micrarchaeales archaeon]